jgi:hypothetical protein
MEKDRGFRVLAIVAICIAIVGLSIGYAALQTTLTITTKATTKAATWSVKFANLGTPTLTGKAAVNTAAAISGDSTTITIDVNLFQPSDAAVYTFDVTNDGTIDAKLNAAPTITGIAAPVLYTLTYADGTAIAANDTLNAGITKNLKLTVTYDPSATTVTSTDVAHTITATMLYVQA